MVFSETKAIDLGNRFRKDADAYYVEAKRSTVSTTAQIPYWVYGLLVVLGWNEAMAILFNPLYFTMLLIFLVSAYVCLISSHWGHFVLTQIVTRYFIVQLGLVGPLFTVLRTLGTEVRQFTR